MALNLDIIKRAKRFAVEYHKDQTRRYTGEPYIKHPVAVSNLVASVTDDVEVIVAAILHDVIEDTTATPEDVARDFGARVAQLVSEVTDVSKPEDGNRRIRKAKDLDHLSKASPEGKTIKLADLIHNSRSITLHDPSFAKVYLLEKRALMDVLKEGDEKLYREAMEILAEYFGDYHDNAR